MQIFLCGGIGEWMWKHLVGLKPAAPAFAEVVVAPKVHPKYGPSSVTGDFLVNESCNRDKFTSMSM